MPKIVNTRKQRADELLTRLKRGPHIDAYPGGPALNEAEISRRYRMWAESWVLDDLVALIPELRGLDWRKEQS